ncbi:ComEC/Rec2 family competence protein [Poseidonocella sedimentorum]|uniref:Competence protein ComEC n=1 Tax=Poseidonocella sedimentorum TaxID=871652 RepID=A0A1I6CRX3_9RHOB|nr:ComEC/Rec2 family competence protein [Poseidonocella sedimentorum]SFQ95909.1 competence protein ComEC [Poseidonocella sedimentorum]
MPIAGGIRPLLLRQRGHLFPWVPVCLALGIGLYFSLKSEPDVALLWAAGVLAAALILAAPRLLGLYAPLAIGAGLVLAGLALGGLRAHSVAEPVLGFRYYGPIEGRIVGIDRSASDALRLTLDQVVLRRMDPARIPARVRISLHGEQGFVDPVPGLRIIATGHLSGPNGPAEPGGFDFRRHAWFQELGAVGYTRVPVLTLEPPARGAADLWVFRLRMALARYVRAALPGETGAVAAAITTGDRSEIGQQTLEHLRQSNLAHLLAISGLHMGLLAGFVFGALRLILATIPRIALNWPVKKCAAVGALLAATIYLALSGGSLATQRAYVMVAVALVAMLVGRRALSLRAVAIAAIIVLVLRPESLLSPGFQMSFAATTALIAVFAELRSAPRLGPKWLRAIGTLMMSSAVAGLATAPFGAAHFNQTSHYGLIANLVSVPVMGILIMPMAVLALFLWPLGLDPLAFAAMKLGLDWILRVAETVSGLPGAVGQIVAPAGYALPVLSVGVLFVILWQGRARWIGVAPVLAVLALWGHPGRPPVLVAETGALVGVLGPEGRVLSREKGSGFIAGIWLENDGDGSEQATAAARAIPELAQGFTIRHVHAKREVAALTRCDVDVLVLTHPAPEALNPQDCLILDPPRLSRLGAVALYPDEAGVRIITAAERSGARLWNTPASKRRGS